MAYLGRRGALAPVTAADIPDNSITTAKIVDDNVTAAKIPAGAVSSDVLYLENATAAQELSGTYATGTERLYFNDLYTLTGDVTIQENAHLALGTIADKDVLIEADTGSTERTITGEGTLDSGNVLQDTHRTSLTDMTGELGSAVVGRGITSGTITSGVTFPAGHILNVVSNSPDIAQTSTTSTNYITSGLSQAITPSATSSKIFITISVSVSVVNSSCRLTIYRDSTNIAPGGDDNTHGFARLTTSSGGDTWENTAIQFLDSPNTTAPITYTLYYRAESGTSALYAGGWTAPTITLMEIQG